MSQLVPRGPASLDRLEDCDANMYSDWNTEKKMLLSLDGLSGLPTGVQTPTTPTLTPTTLRVIAATDLFSLDDCETTTYHNEAGFVPPVVQTLPLSSSLSSTYMVDSKSWQGGSVTTMPSTLAFPSTTASVPTTATVPSSSAPTSTAVPTTSAAPPTTQGVTTTSTPPRRNVGGRRPTKAKGISPEEEERRQVRRERNKAAAARCRKRRMDHTNALIKETEGLEQKKQGLQLEIQDLTAQVEDLEYILDAHRTTGTCRYPRPDSPPDIKPVVFPIKEEPHPPCQAQPIDQPNPNPTPAKRPMLAMPAPAPAQPKPLRPTSLPVPSHTSLKMASEVAGISITTPSTGISLNFDSLMDGGTGLTPVSGPLVPSCSSQQRTQNCVDMSSPDGSIGNKLVSL